MLKANYRSNIKLIILYTCIMFFAMLFLFIFSNWIMGLIVHTRKEVKVPNIQNMNFTEADNLVRSLGLKLIVEGGMFSQDVSPDSVLSQIPEPFLTVREGKKIKIIISRGGEHIEIPDVVNMPQRMAEITIRNNGGMIGQERFAYSVVFEKDRVMKQNPESFTIMQRGVMINLVISKGLPPKKITLMPQMQEMSLNNAEEILNDMNIKYKIIYNVINLDAIQEDIDLFVLNQYPLPDTNLTKKDKAVLTVGLEEDLLEKKSLEESIDIFEKID